MNSPKTKATRERGSRNSKLPNNIEPETALCQGCGTEFTLKACSHRLCLKCWRWQRVGKNLSLNLKLLASGGWPQIKSGKL